MFSALFETLRSAYYAYSDDRRYYGYTRYRALLNTYYAWQEGRALDRTR